MGKKKGSRKNQKKGGHHPLKNQEPRSVASPAPALPDKSTVPDKAVNDVPPVPVLPDGAAAEYTVAKAGDPIDVWVRREEGQDGWSWGGIDCNRFHNLAELLYDQRDGMKNTRFAKITKAIYERHIIKTDDEEYVQKEFEAALNEFWVQSEFNCGGIYFKVQIEPIKFVLSSESPKTPDEESEKREPKKPEIARRKDQPVKFVKVDRLPSAGNPDDALFSRIRLDLLPGTRSTLLAYAKKDLSISSVSVSINGVSAWQWNIARCKEAKDHELFLDQTSVSLAGYQKLKGNPKIEVRLEWSSGGKKSEKKYTLPSKTLAVNIDERYFATDDNRRILLMDMGSTNTKYILMPIKKNGEIRPEDFTKDCKQYYPTEDFIEDVFGIDTLGVPLERFKPTMRDAPEKYSQFLKGAIRKIADILFDEQGVILDRVMWSFPDTKNRDDGFFDYVNQAVFPGVQDRIISGFSLIPEHQSLRYMFAGFLEMIGKTTQKILEKNKQKQKQISDEAEEEKRRQADNNVKNTGLIGRIVLVDKFKTIFSNIRINRERDAEIQKQNDEIKEMRPVLEKGLKLLAVIESRSYLFLDAGGFSLDSVCALNGIKIEDLCRSFVCGGEDLKEKLYDLEYERLGHDEEWKEIGKAKIEREWFVRGVPSDDVKESLKKATEEVYKKAVNIISQHGREIALLIISGGASRNEFFLPMFDKFTLSPGIVKQCQEATGQDKIKITPALPVFSSQELVKFMDTFEKITEVKLERRDFFKSIVSDDNGHPGSRFDIVGGMLQKLTNFYGCDRLDD